MSFNWSCILGWENWPSILVLDCVLFTNGHWSIYKWMKVLSFCLSQQYVVVVGFKLKLNFISWIISTVSFGICFILESLMETKQSGRKSSYWCWAWFETASACKRALFNWQMNQRAFIQFITAVSVSAISNKDLRWIASVEVISTVFFCDWNKLDQYETRCLQSVLFVNNFH